MLNSYYINSTSVKLDGYSSSMQGGRQENQDDSGFLDTPLGVLVIVCDGMGGGPGGKTASGIAKRTIAATLANCNELTPPEQALRDAFCKANEVLLSKMDENPSLKGMGTTAVAILIGKKELLVAHAGDSRCYHIRKSKVIWRSADHSLVGELVQKGVMTEEQARVSNQSNVITRALGATNNHTPDIHHIEYEKGDRFILCTDGVWGMMSNDKLVVRLAQNSGPENIVSSIQEEIDNLGFAEGGYHDNHTLSIVDLKENSIIYEKMKKISKIIITILAAFIVLLLCFLIYNSIELSSCKTDLENCRKQIEILTPYQKRYNDLINQSDDKTKDVYSENIELHKRIIELENEISKVKETNDKSKEQEVSNNTNKKTESKLENQYVKKSVGNNNNSEKNILVQRAINRFGEIKNFKLAKNKVKDNLSDAASFVKKKRDEIVSMMNNLIKVDPSNKSTYEGIQRNIESENTPLLKIKVSSSGEQYEPTMDAVKLAEKHIDKLSKIKK